MSAIEEHPAAKARQRIAQATQSGHSVVDLSLLGLFEIPFSTDFTAGKRAGLTELDLGHNQLTALPDSIERLTNLQELWIEGNPHLPRHRMATRESPWD